MLPYDLICTQSFFSSVFVEIGPAQVDSGHAGHANHQRSGSLVVHNQMWIAIVSTILLIFATFGAFFVWKHPLGRLMRTSA